jgi:hypothetical protein
VIWRLFKRRPAPAGDDGWWREAEALTERPGREGLDRLRDARRPASTDDAERQDEMLDGLDELVTIAETAVLPVVVTQHRVIGTDVCHLVIPATLVADASTPGKLLLTSTRLIFAGAGSQSWPWHRVRRVVRGGRDLIAILGGDTGARFQCNTYGEALVAQHVATRLIAPRASPPAG